MKIDAHVSTQEPATYPIDHSQCQNYSGSPLGTLNRNPTSDFEFRNYGYWLWTNTLSSYRAEVRP